MVYIKVAKGLKDRQRFILTLNSGISEGLRALWILDIEDLIGPL